MPDDSRTVSVTFQLDPQTAAALADPVTHGHVEQVIQSTVRKAGIDRLFAAMDALSAEAARPHRRDPREEVAAHNAEHRDPKDNLYYLELALAADADLLVLHP